LWKVQGYETKFELELIALLETFPYASPVARIQSVALSGADVQAHKVGRSRRSEMCLLPRD
jgi:hypothetical protein